MEIHHWEYAGKSRRGLRAWRAPGRGRGALRVAGAARGPRGARRPGSRHISALLWQAPHQEASWKPPGHNGVFQVTQNRRLPHFNALTPSVHLAVLSCRQSPFLTYPVRRSSMSEDASSSRSGSTGGGGVRGLYVRVLLRLLPPFSPVPPCLSEDPRRSRLPEAGIHVPTDRERHEPVVRVPAHRPARSSACRPSAWRATWSREAA